MGIEGKFEKGRTLGWTRQHLRRRRWHRQQRNWRKEEKGGISDWIRDFVNRARIDWNARKTHEAAPETEEAADEADAAAPEEVDEAAAL